MPSPTWTPEPPARGAVDWSEWYTPKRSWRQRAWASAGWLLLRLTFALYASWIAMKTLQLPHRRD